MARAAGHGYAHGTGIWYEEAHHSTAIEGNTLVLKQVEILLAEGRAVGSRELREYNEVKGYADAADWVYRQAAAPGTYQDVRCAPGEVGSTPRTVRAHPDVPRRQRQDRQARTEPHPATARLSPAIIYKHDRSRYLRALRRADNGEHGELGETIARAVLDNLYRFVVPAVAGPARLVPLAALVDDRICQPALRTAAQRGRLQAMRGPL